MRLRTLAGLVAGVLSTGLLVTAAPAHAAPTSLQVSQLVTCAFGNFTMEYPADLSADVDGAQVAGALAEPLTTGMPAMVTVSAIKVDLTTNIDDESVALTGSETYSPAKPGNTAFTMPALSGTRAETDVPSAIEITDAVLTITAMGRPTVVDCDVAEAPAQLSAGETLTCPFNDFSMTYPAELTATVAGKDVAGELAEPFTPGMPAFVTVSALKVDLETLVDGEAVTLSGEETFDPAKPGDSTFTLPTLSGQRVGEAAAQALEITGAALTITAMGRPTVVECTVEPAGPSPECLDAEEALAAAEGALAAAATKVTDAATKVAKAKAKVKRLKDAKGPKAKKRLKAAKAKLKLAKAQHAAAVAAHGAAEAAVEAAAAAVDENC